MPQRMPSVALSIDAQPVMTMISTWGSSLRIVRIRSSPPIPGMCRSRVTRSTSWVRSNSRASAAWRAWSTRCAGERIMRSDSRGPRSSSTIRTVALSWFVLMAPA